MSVPLGVDRPNHYQVTSVNQQIPVWQYLSGRFTTRDIRYLDSSGSLATESVTIPVSRRSNMGVNPTGRYAYSPEYTPMYVSFRYIMWDALANEGRGQIISGPMSNIVTVAALKHPFDQDPGATVIFGKPCCTVSPDYDKFELLCTIETKLP